MLTLGLNLGGDATKAVTPITSCNFMSLIADREDGTLGTPKGIVFEESCGKPLLVGDVALLFGGNANHDRDDRWTQSDEFLHLTHAALSEVTQDSYDTGLCVVSVPMALYHAQKQVIIDRLQTTHRFQRVGRDPQVITLTKVVPLPEPVCAGYKQIFDSAGRTVRQDLLDGTFAVADFGSRHTHAAVVTQGIDVKSQSKTIPVGVWKIVGKLHEFIEAKLDRKITLQQARNALVTRSIKDSGVIVQLGAECDKAVAHVAPEILHPIVSLWPNWKDFDAIFLTGGGVNLLGVDMRTHFPKAITLDQPIMGNAEGNLRYALHIASELGL